MSAASWQSRLAFYISAIGSIGLGGLALAGEAEHVQAKPPADSTRASAPTARDTAHPLYLLTYDHGGLVLWGSDHFAKHLQSAAEWLDRYPGFKIGLDNEAYTYDELARRDPKLLERIRGYLKRYPGRFGIGTCTYGQPLSVFINEESNVRQIQYALEADRRHLGCAPDVYLMSEHAMHSQIPQLLKGFGFRGAIMRTHFMMYGYNPTFDVPIGWWVGVDGSRIPAVPTYHGEGAQFGRTTRDNWVLTRYPGPECNTPLEEFRKQFGRIQPLLATRADDAALRREDLVRKYEGNPEYRWLLLEDVLPAFPAPVAELKTAPNDFRVRMPWGYCGNEIWNESRRAEVAVLTAERLAAMESMLGGAGREAELEQAWKDLLVAQHHDIQICGLLPDARKFLPASLAKSHRVTEAALRYVAGRMSGGGVGQVTVFNPLSWPRREWVEVPVSLPRGAAKALAAHRGPDAVPVALLSADRYSDGSIREGRLALLADPPPLGFASYALDAAKDAAPPRPDAIQIDPAKLRVTTPHLEIGFLPEGGIASLRDVRAGRELLKAGRRSGIFAGTIDGRPCESKGRWSLEPARGGAPWAVARQSGLIGSIPYHLEITVRADQPRLDCRATFRFAGQQIGRVSDNPRDSVSGFLHEEKLRFKLFPAVGDNAVGVRDLPFVVSPTADRYVEGNYWIALADGNTTLALFNRGTMGSVREPDGGFSLPLAFAMYYVWGTRMLNGDFTYEFALYPLAGGWEGADLHRRALEYNFPCVAICTPSGNTAAGGSLRLPELDSPGVVVSAMYTKGGKTYVRMYESRGENGQMAFRVRTGDVLPGPVALTEVDLAGRDLGPVSSPLSFRPWQIRTFRIATNSR